MYYFELLRGLFANDIRYLLVGGLAVNLHGIPRVTHDVDIIIAMERKNILKLNKLLKGLGYKPRLPVDPDDLANPATVVNWINDRNMKAFSYYHQNDYKVVDIVIVHDINFDAAFMRKRVTKVEDFEVYLLSIDDLIKMKSKVGRSQDLSDVEMLNKLKSYLGDDNDG